LAEKPIIALVKAYLSALPAEIRVRNAFLFGSYAKGTAHPDSDIDIALFIEDMGDFFQMQSLLRKCRRRIDLRIEPHPIDEKDDTPENPFATEIHRTGIELPIS
jgi:uncharacterized protein